MNSFDLLQTLCETPGPSGFEEDIAAVIQEIWEPLTDEISVDRTGSLSARRKGSGSIREGSDRRPTIMLAAHMDELGLMVTKLLEYGGNGFLRVTNLGGVDWRQTAGQMVMVHGFDPISGAPKNLPGVIGNLPGRMLPAEYQGKPYTHKTLVVDTGLPFETLKNYVSVGNAISFHRPLHKLQDYRVAGKALDNRCSIAIVTICLEQLVNRNHEWDVLAVATSQEETGLLGAFNTANNFKPDIAIAIDVTFGSGPLASDERTFKLGEGPVIGHMPDTHPGVRAGLKQVAEKLEMNVQSEYGARPGGTDAYHLQIAAEGIPTGIIGVGLRYMHTMTEHIDVRDVERTGRLLAEYIAELNDETISGFRAMMMD
ncbi:MAG: putative aminopeptidase FrvX [Cellvibrionaceae bacterium]|jgi:putative aminopeptidase FrvX